MPRCPAVRWTVDTIASDEFIVSNIKTNTSHTRTDPLALPDMEAIAAAIAALVACTTVAAGALSVCPDYQS